MKKSIILIMCVLTVSLFIMQYSLTNHDNFDKVVYSEKELNNYYSIQLPHSILENETSDIIKEIKNQFSKYHASFFITKTNNSHHTKYAYVYDEQSYKEILKVDDIYQADTNHKDSRNRIEQFDDTFQLTIKELSDIEKDGYQLEGEAFIVLEDASQYKNLKFSLEQALSIEIKEISEGSGSVDMMLWLMLSIFAFYLVLTLLITYDLFKSFRTFAIYKLNGYSSFTIWKDYIIQIMSIMVIVSLGGYLLLTLIICGRINEYVMSFLSNSIFILSIIGIITFILSSIIILSFTKVKAIDYLKNKNISGKFMIFNQFILLCIVIITVALSSVGIGIGQSILSRMNNSKEWEQLKDYYILSELTHVEDASMFSSDSFREKQKQLFIEFNQLGSLLVEFSDFDEETISDRSMAYVNVNYINNQQIKDTNNQLIEISEDEIQRVVLVPENTTYTKQGIIDLTEGMFDISKGVKIIYYDAHQTFFTMNSQITENYTNMITQPIVQVLTNSNGQGSDYDLIMGYKYNPYKIKADQKTISNILDKYDLSRYVEKYITAYDEMASLNHNESLIFLAVVLALVVLIILILLILIQNIHIYINQNIKRLSIENMHGYSFIDKYESLILMSVCTLFISYIVTYLLGYPLDYLVIIYALIICLWSIIFKTKTNSLEKKSIVKMLKGSQ